MFTVKIYNGGRPTDECEACTLYQADRVSIDRFADHTRVYLPTFMIWVVPEDFPMSERGLVPRLTASKVIIENAAGQTTDIITPFKKKV